MTNAVRKIVSIDKEKCNGCGICVSACHEGAIRMVDGKAELVSDSYCDGLGDCLAPCPTGAISIVERAADAYDEEAVRERMAGRHVGGGCPGSAVKSLKAAGAPAQEPEALPCGCPGSLSQTLKSESGSCACESGASAASELMNWPVQLRLVPPSAPYLRGADILLAADCAPVAVPDFHRRYMRNRPVIIACPKLEDNGPQIAKLAEILKTAQPASITVVRLEVPCCGGLVRAAEQAVAAAGTGTPVRAVVVGIDGSEKLQRG